MNQFFRKEKYTFIPCFLQSSQKISFQQKYTYQVCTIVISLIVLYYVTGFVTGITKITATIDNFHELKCTRIYACTGGKILEAYELLPNKCE